MKQKRNEGNRFKPWGVKAIKLLKQILPRYKTLVMGPQQLQLSLRWVGQHGQTSPLITSAPLYSTQSGWGQFKLAETSLNYPLQWAQIKSNLVTCTKFDQLT